MFFWSASDDLFFRFCVSEKGLHLCFLQDIFTGYRLEHFPHYLFKYFSILQQFPIRQILHCRNKYTPQLTASSFEAESYPISNVSPLGSNTVMFFSPPSHGLSADPGHVSSIFLIHSSTLPEFSEKCRLGVSRDNSQVMEAT